MAAMLAWCAAAWGELTWAEVSGSVGDLGTFLPLLIGLVQKVNLDLGTTLIVTGVYNIVSGWQFGIPMCVQPMKTIAAVALAASQPALTLPQLLHGGLFVAACVALLGATRLVDLVNWAVPRPVVRGVQLAVGAKLAIKGIDMALRVHPPAPAPAPAGGAQWRPALGCEGLLLGGAALAVLLVTTIAPGVTAAGSLDAAEDGGLGPRPRDTPFEPLLRRLGRCRAGVCPAAESAKAAAAATLPPAAASDAGIDGSNSGAGVDSSSSETSQLLPAYHATHAGTDANKDAHVDVEAAATATATVASIQVTCDGAAGALPRPGGCGGCGGGRRVPSALLAVVLGLALAVVGRPGLLGQLRLGPSVPTLLRPSWSDLREGALRAGLPQLPLTALNSVIAVSALADGLFGGRPDSARWRPSAVALSVGLLNLGGCWLGAMPCCHGAGGLAAQYKFGARSGAAPVLLGVVKAALGLAFGGSLSALLGAFPAPLLGALLAVAGVELATAVRLASTPRGSTLALLTAAAILSLDNTGTGFLLGLAAAAVVALYDATTAAAARWVASAGGGDGRRALRRILVPLGGLSGARRADGDGADGVGQGTQYRRL